MFYGTYSHPEKYKHDIPLCNFYIAIQYNFVLYCNIPIYRYIVTPLWDWVWISDDAIHKAPIWNSINSNTRPKLSQFMCYTQISTNFSMYHRSSVWDIIISDIWSHLQLNSQPPPPFFLINSSGDQHAVFSFI